MDKVNPLERKGTRKQGSKRQKTNFANITFFHQSISKEGNKLINYHHITLGQVATNASNAILYLLRYAFQTRLTQFQFSSVAQSHPTLCDPMDCSTPGLPVHHRLPEFTQTHVHWVSDAIQPSHLLSSPFLLPSVLPSVRVFSNESALHIRWPKYWSFSFNINPFSEHSGLISFTTDWLDLLAVQGTLKSLLQHHSSKALKFS